MATYASISGIDPDTVARFLLEGLFIDGQLSDVIAAGRFNKQGDTGDVIRVPKLGSRTAQGPITAGSPLTPADTSVSNVSITIQKFGDAEDVPKEVLEDQQSFGLGDLLRGHARGLAAKRDALIYAALIAAVPTATTDLTSAGDLTDLYEAIVDNKAALEKLGVRADSVVLGPDQHAALLKITDEGVKDRNIVAANGVVSTVAGLRVYPYFDANDNTATPNAVQAVLFEKARAVGEGWGRQPEAWQDDQSAAQKLKDSVQIGVWMRYGTSVLDAVSIGHVLNP